MKKSRMTSLLVSAALIALMSGTALAGGVWNCGANGDPQSLDPHKTSTVEEANLIRDLFTGLVAQDKDANLIPGAAASWTISPDGLVYTFKLRPDYVWSDGTPVTADDFVFSMAALSIRRPPRNTPPWRSRSTMPRK